MGGSHTHHLTPQEYYHSKSNWWLHSNETGSNTVPVKHRLDFKQALSTLQQLKEKEARILEEINNGHRVLLLLGGVGKVHCGLLIPMKVTTEMNQVLTEQGDLLYKYLEHFFRAWFSWIQSFCYRWIVYSWLRSTATDGVCEYNTSNDVFSRCKKCARIWLQAKSDDQLIQLDNKLELGTSFKIKLAPRWNWNQKWKIQNWPWLRGDTARCEHQW